jgi:endonuclease-3
MDRYRFQSFEEILQKMSTAKGKGKDRSAAVSQTAKKTLSETAGPEKTGRAANRSLAAERIAAILRGLDEAYPNVECALTHRSPWELLVATILSAQCTDVRVNLVTPELFRRFPSPEAMGAATLPELEALIRTTGFFRNKAKSIPGAARKTANVVLGVWFGKAEGVVVDTHVFRIARRLGLAKGDTPQKVETELMRILPQDRWIAFSHQLIHHGRRVCDARKPRCSDCSLEQLCLSKDKTWSS